MPAGLMAEVPSTIAAEPDLARMQRDRGERLRSLMRDQGLDAMVLLGNTNVIYSTGAVWPLADPGRTNFEQPVAVVLADDEHPHLFTPASIGDGGAALPEDHVHGAVYLDFDEGVEAFAAQLSGLVPERAVVAVDEWTHALRRERTLLFANDDPADAGRVIGTAKVLKTPDELSCLRRCLAITERAVTEVQAKLAPGVRQIDLSATFFRHAFEEGADANILDPIWQVMAPSMADQPWTTTGDLACPLLTTERELREGDVLWVDCAVTWAGMHSDFGRTWVVGREPDARQHDQFARWRAIMDAVLALTRAGSTAADLTAAAIEANDGVVPWMPHFYLGHGLGTDTAEAPFVGSDLGQAFDESLVLEAGMILVLEPTVWDDGAAGYRAEEVVVITEDGWEPMTDYTYDPF